MENRLLKPDLCTFSLGTEIMSGNLQFDVWMNDIVRWEDSIWSFLEFSNPPEPPNTWHDQELSPPLTLKRYCLLIAAATEILNFALVLMLVHLLVFIYPVSWLRSFLHYFILFLFLCSYPSVTVFGFVSMLLPSLSLSPFCPLCPSHSHFSISKPQKPIRGR